MWVLRIQLRSFIRAASALTTEPSLWPLVFIFQMAMIFLKSVNYLPFLKHAFAAAIVSHCVKCGHVPGGSLGRRLRTAEPPQAGRLGSQRTVAHLLL